MASVPACARRRRPQHDDAVVVVAHAQLAGRADHAVRGAAVGLAGGDPEVAGQHAAGQDTTTLSPTAKLRAPQTISCGVSRSTLALPTSTVQKRMAS